MTKQNHEDSLSPLRRRAEDLVHKPAPANLEDLSPAAIQGLVHDLQVHQIELELQNEELRRAQLELHASRDKYAHLYDFAPVGYFTLDENGTILEANLTGATLLGVARSLLIGQLFSQFVDWEDRDRYAVQRRRLLESGNAPASEIRLVSKGGSQFYAHLEGTAIGAGEGNFQQCRIVVSDITERVRAEEALKRLNQELENRVETRTRALYRRAAELEALVNVSSTLRQAITVEETIAILIKETVNAFQAQAAAILLLENDALVVAGLSGPPSTWLGYCHLPGDDPFWQVVNTGRPILLNSVELAEFAASRISQILASGMARMALVPLQAAEETLGLLLIAFSQPDWSFEEFRGPLAAIGEMGGNALRRVKATETLEQLVRDRTRDLATLYEVTTTTTQHLDTQIILERVLDKTLEAIDADAGIIHLLDEAAETLRMAVQRGISPGLINRVQAQPPGDSLWGQVMERKETLVVPDLSVDLATPQALYPEEYPTYIGVPIFTVGRVLGVFSVFGETILKFSAEDIALLAAIADHIGAAVEGAQLRQRAEQAAVMEERQRLARELHDSVTQSLYSLTLFAEAAQDSARAADLTQVQQYLGRVGETALQALKGMRLLIYQLHPPALRQEGLVGALHRRLEAVERRAGVETQLLVETSLQVPASVEAGLYRIAQEALNNVLKHSAATQVTVRLSAGNEGLQLQVTDNGKGFNPEAVEAQGGIGLASMQERVENLRGSLQIVSRPGQGTRIRVVVPLARSA